MSDSPQPEENQEESREPFQEVTPSGRVRTRRRPHSGPYNAPIPEAADLHAMRLHPLPGQESAARKPAQGGSDSSKMEDLVRRVAAELQREADGESTAIEEQPARGFAGPPTMPHGEHPADKVPPPLPASVASLNRLHEFDEHTGKRKRKRGDAGEHGGRRKCPFCDKHRALHIRPANPAARAISLLGIRTYSCRNCHNKFLAFAFVEGPYFTWRQVGIVALILLICLVGAIIAAPMINRIPDIVDP